MVLIITTIKEKHNLNVLPEDYNVLTITTTGSLISNFTIFKIEKLTNVIINSTETLQLNTNTETNVTVLIL